MQFWIYLQWCKRNKKYSWKRGIISHVYCHFINNNTAQNLLLLKRLCMRGRYKKGQVNDLCIVHWYFLKIIHLFTYAYILCVIVWGTGKFTVHFQSNFFILYQPTFSMSLLLLKIHKETDGWISSLLSDFDWWAETKFASLYLERRVLNFSHLNCFLMEVGKVVKLRNIS
jgi:hypothetical protein